MAVSFHASDSETILMDTPSHIMLLYNKQFILYIMKCHICVRIVSFDE